MEILFSQRHQYYRINPYKNYSSILDKPKIEEVSLFGSRIIPSVRNESDMQLKQQDHPQKRIIPSVRNESGFYLQSKGEAKGYFYYIDENKTHLQNRPIFIRRLLKETFETSNERHVKQHYMNPLAEVEIHTIERSIVKRGNKITAKLYHFNKYRELNRCFFRKITSITSVTFDINTGNFTTGYIFYQGKHQKIAKFRKNNFIELSTVFNSYNGLFFMGFCQRYRHIFDNDEFYFKFRQLIFGENLIQESIINKNQSLESLFNDTLEYFIKKKQIKIPNDYREYLVYFYPTERYLKKNNRKLIDAILDRYGIKCDLTNKLLHKNSKLNVESLKMVCCLFGKNFSKYVGNIPIDSLDKLFDRQEASKLDFRFIEKYRLDDNINNVFSNITPKEKDNILSILNSGYFKEPKQTSIIGFIQVLIDHFNMKSMLLPYYPNISLNAKTYNTLIDEHTRFSTLTSLIKKQVVVEYVYDPYTINVIEEPIGEFYPYILKSEEDYIEEGEFMHHCVASYAEQQTSMIVSLRSKDKKERVTSEYIIENGCCVQSKYFTNHSYPEKFNDHILTLNNRIKKLAQKNKLNWIEKKYRKVILNGNKIQSQEATNVEEDVEYAPF